MDADVASGSFNCYATIPVPERGVCVVYRNGWFRINQRKGWIEGCQWLPIRLTGLLHGHSDGKAVATGTQVVLSNFS